ncbi:MAG: YbaB/EbfC family nucleoid-associated protein [Verrucomicrobiota bacterium]
MDMNKMMKQAQKMQKDMEVAQQEVSGMTRTFTAGGMVTAVATGDNDICELTIDPAAIDPDDAEGLEDLVQTAVNGALKEVQAAAGERLSAVTGGFSLPGM